MAREILDPVTPKEWQTAVDAAHGSLALAAARDYGLVTGGPVVNVERCNQILERGAEMGVTPSPDAIERFTLGLAAAALS